MLHQSSDRPLSIRYTNSNPILIYKNAARNPDNPAKPKTYFPISAFCTPPACFAVAEAARLALAGFEEVATVVVAGLAEEVTATELLTDLMVENEEEDEWEVIMAEEECDEVMRVVLAGFAVEVGRVA